MVAAHKQEHICEQLCALRPESNLGVRVWDDIYTFQCDLAHGAKSAYCGLHLYDTAGVYARQRFHAGICCVDCCIILLFPSLHRRSSRQCEAAIVLRRLLVILLLHLLRLATCDIDSSSTAVVNSEDPQALVVIECDSNAYGADELNRVIKVEQ